MDYIVVDLEWNQSPYGKSSSNKKLPFEIIEIGAVKLNSEYKEIGRFDVLIKPKVYKKLHHITKSLTGITEAQLNEGVHFPEAVRSFLDWCGPGYIFCTWGNLDLLELQRNLRFYHMEELLKGPIKYYNIQKLFRIFYDNENSAASLEYAVDFFNIKKDEDFHRAIHDAEYTAVIFSKMNPEDVAPWYTLDYYQNPKNRKQEIKLVYDTYSKFVSKEFDTKEDAMADRIVRTTRCYKCGKSALKRIRWFSNKNKTYYCLAECAEHGYIRGKIRLKKTERGNHYYVVKTLRLIDGQDAKQIADMKQEVRIKRQEKRHREGRHEG